MTNNLFLVDTSAWLLALHKDFLPDVKDRIAYLLKENAIITSGMIKLELLGGTKTEKEFQRLKTRLDALEMVKTNTSLWEKAYDLSFRLRRKGITVPYTDILIAASAIVVAATVVHADSHFDLMGPHCGLKVESFVKATKKVKK
ncbi:MAG: PIN domain-containing protein [Desulfobacterales bacterium]|nr:MAG: PIN domain-containing protein [Desulfobacterales bacterium]